MPNTIRNLLFILPKQLKSTLYTLCYFCLCLVSSEVLADSAAAWKAYQDGKNPVADFLILILGIALFLGILVWLNKLNDKKRKKKTKK